MLEHIRSKKIEMIVLSTWILILNTYKIVFHVIGVDTEQALLEFDSNLNWTLGSGRFASAFLRKVLMPSGFSYDMAMLLTIIGWLAVCMAYIFCFERIANTNKWCILFFAMLFISCPLWAEQSYFVCSNFVNVYGMLFTVIAAYFLVNVVQRKFRPQYITISIILGIAAIGIYQALLYLFLANCVIFLSLDMYSQKDKVRNYVISGIKCIAISVMLVIVYFVCSKVAVTLLYNPSFDYAGYVDATEYVSNRMKWFHGDILGCIKAIRLYVMYSYKSDYVYGIPIYPILFVLVQTFIIIRFIKKRNEQDIIMLIGNILLLLCVFIGCLFLGGNISVREQFVLPLLVAFYSMFLINEITNMVSDEVKLKKFILFSIVVISLYAIMFWGGKQLQINNSDFVRYNADVSYAEKVMDEIGFQVGNYSDRKIVFIGQNQWSLPELYYKGEVIGRSIFSWDSSGPVGVNYRVYGFLQVCGYKYIKPSIDEINEIQNICINGEIFEDNGCVTMWNGFIVVNLNSF